MSIQPTATKTLTQEHKDCARRIQAAKVALLLGFPFFGTRSLKLPWYPTEHPEIDTAATDGKSAWYNVEFMNSLSMQELLGLVAHETWHGDFDHPYRRMGRDLDEWNDACDFSVNAIIQAAGLYLPPDALLDPQYKGMSPEAIYEKRRAGRIKMPKGKPNPDAATEGDGADGGDGEGLPNEQGLTKPSNKPAKGKSNGKKVQTDDPQADPDDGQGQGTPDEQDEKGQGSVSEPERKKKKWGQVIDSPLPQEEQQAAMSENKIEMMAAAAIARGQGSLPSYLEEVLSEIFAPKNDIASRLRQFIADSGFNDYSYETPDPEYIHQNIFIPTIGSPEVGEVVIAFDTSGSVWGGIFDSQQKLLDTFGAVIMDIIKDANPKVVHVIYADSRVQKVERYEQGDKVEIKPVGGGGTDFGPLFDHVEKMGDEVKCVVYLTDLEGNFPRYIPSVPVIWVSTRDHHAPFGEKVILKP